MSVRPVTETHHNSTPHCPRADVRAFPCSGGKEREQVSTEHTPRGPRGQARSVLRRTPSVGDFLHSRRRRAPAELPTQRKVSAELGSPPTRREQSGRPAPWTPLPTRPRAGLCEAHGHRAQPCRLAERALAWGLPHGLGCRRTTVPPPQSTSSLRQQVTDPKEKE